MDNIQVLDHGFVRLIDHMGSDLSVANAARISMGNRKEELDEKDVSLIHFLANNDHSTPFRSAYVTLHLRAPIFVLRQWMKHTTGCSWNELSARYRELKDYHTPTQFRTQSASVKQGSDGVLPEDENEVASVIFAHACESAFESYHHLLRMGVAKEQARAVLPLGVYSECYWTASLQAVAHFLELRLDAHAQKEIREYAQAVRALIEPFYPVSLAALLKEPQGGTNG